jgi:hypothetical protein
MCIIVLLTANFGMCCLAADAMLEGLLSSASAGCIPEELKEGLRWDHIFTLYSESFTFQCSNGGYMGSIPAIIAQLSQLLPVKKLYSGDVQPAAGDARHADGSALHCRWSRTLSKHQLDACSTGA